MQCSLFEYLPGKPEENILCRVIAEQLETFLMRQRDREHPVPKFVEQEFRSLECGIPAYLRSRSLRLMRSRPHCGLQLQGPRVVPWVWRKTHGRHGGAL